MSNTLSADFEQRHQELADEGKKEYEKLYQRLIGKLSASHLEPIVQFLLENIGTDFNAERTIESMKTSLLEQLMDNWYKNIWEPLASKRVAALEMLKEHFKEHEGVTNWNINCMSPEQRVRPLHLRYKFARLHFLKTHVERQNKVLEEKYAKAIQRRQFLQEVVEQCIMYNKHIEELTSEERQKKEEAIKEEVSLFLNDKSIFESRPKIKPEF